MAHDKSSQSITEQDLRERFLQAESRHKDMPILEYITAMGEEAKLIRNVFIRHLCDSMQEKLPPELRDQIYTFISTDDSVCIYPSEYLSEMRQDALGASHLDESWLGEQTINELVENYFRTSCFRFNLKYRASVRTFLAMDFGVQVADLVSKLEFTHRYMYYWDDDPGMLFTRERTEEVEAIEDAEGLFRMKHGTHIRVTLSFIKIDIDVQFPDVTPTGARAGFALSAWFPLIVRFHEARYNVELLVQSEGAKEWLLRPGDGPFEP